MTTAAITSVLTFMGVVLSFGLITAYWITKIRKSLLQELHQLLQDRARLLQVRASFPAGSEPGPAELRYTKLVHDRIEAIDSIGIHKDCPICQPKEPT